METERVAVLPPGGAVATAAARLLAAPPPGVLLEALQGPWIIPAGDVVFEVGATGARRVLARTADTIVYAGTLYDERVTIEQAHPTLPDDINAWLARVRFQYGVRAEGVLPVYGAVIDVDGGGVPAFYTVAQRATSSVASAVLAADGALAHIGTVARLRLVWQSAAALAALHARRIVHGAVTPANVLLSSTDESDGAVRVVGYNTTAGTPGSAASDVHSWGLLAWCVFAGTPTPATADGPPPMAALVERGVPAAAVDVISECLLAEPEARPAMAVVARTLAAALSSSRKAAADRAAATCTGCSTPGEPLSASAAAARNAMLQLALKTISPEATRALVASGAGCAAAATLRAFVTDVAVVRAACVALHNLSMTESPAARLQLQKNGAGAALVAAIMAHASDAEVLRAACNSLSFLTEVEPVRRLLVQCDGVGGALVAALRSDAADSAVAQVACGTLQDLSAAPDHALALYRDGCGEAAIAALQRHVNDAEVAVAACSALKHLAALEVDCTVFVNDGAGATVVGVLKQHIDNVSVLVAALSAIWNITGSVDDKCSMPLVRDHDAAAAVVAAAQRHSNNAEVVGGACGTLLNLTTSADTCELLVRDASVITVVVAALQRHASDVGVATDGCWVLSNVTDVESGQTLLAQDGSASASAEVVIGLLRRHVRNGAVVEAACRALWGLAQLRTVRMVLPQVEDAGAAVLAALQNHYEYNADTVYAVTGMLCCLARYGCLHGVLGPLMGEHDTVTTLQDAMDAFPDNAGLQLHCDELLTLLH